MNVEKMSLAVFDEMRQIIGENRISREAFLSAIARGFHVAIEAKAEADAQIVHEAYLAWFDGDHSPSEAFEGAKEKIRARNTE